MVGRGGCGESESATGNDRRDLPLLATYTRPVERSRTVQARLWLPIREMPLAGVHHYALGIYPYRIPSNGHLLGGAVTNYPRHTVP